MKKIAGSLITLFLLLAVLLTPLAAYGSDTDPVRPDDASWVYLMAGQHIYSGKVYVWSDEENLYVQFVTDNGWSLGETHLYVGMELPKKVAPGQFLYKDQEFYTIPLSELGASSGSELYIAAHAVVQKGGQQETAWGQGDAFAKSWAMYFRYTVRDSVPGR